MPDARKREPILRVFLSSTKKDLEAYRDAVAEKIEALGQAASRMETFSAEPNAPVEVCRKRVAEADAVVLVVAHCYGWVPTTERGGDGKKSITWLEVEAAITATPKVPVFAFVVDPDHEWTGPRDSRALEEAEDEAKERKILHKIRQLRNFKTFIDADAGIMRATFTTPDNLAGKAAVSLGNWLRKRDREPPPPPTRHAPQETAGGKKIPGLDRYLRRLCAEHAFQPVAGFPKTVRMRVKLSDVYIPLRAQAHRAFFDHELGDLGANRDLLRHQAEADADLPFDDVFARLAAYGGGGLVVLGNPGGGKTTLLRHFTLAGCEADSAAEMGLPAGVVPVFVELRRLTDPGAGLAAAIRETVARKPLSVPDAERFTAGLLEADRLLVLLDGLDEVADVEQRAAVSRWLESAVGEQPGSIFVVSSRYAGYYEGEVRVGGRFLELTVRDLEEPEARAFLADWYRAVETRTAIDRDEAVSKALADEASADLAERVFGGDARTASLRELARNPLMLQILCLVHRDSKRLPEERVALYNDCCRVLLQLWREAKDMPVELSAQQAMRLLQPVAWALHSSGDREAPASVIAPVMREPLRALGRDPEAAEAILASIRDQSGLLVFSQGQWSFLHLSFQEYLAARHVKAQGFEQPSLVAELASRFGDDRWREVILLALGLDTPSLFGPLIGQVIAQHRLHHDPSLADDCLRDASEKPPLPLLACLAAGIANVRERLAALRMLRSLPAWHEESLDGDSQIGDSQDGGITGRDIVARMAKDDEDDAVRRLAGELLLRAGASTEAEAESPQPRADLAFAVSTRGLSDAEPGEERVHEADGSVLVFVPGSTYTLGSDDNSDRERPVYTVELSPFWIGKYPVTNEQYRRFLAAEEGREEPAFWNERRWNDPQQPVVGVSWHDAMAYCAWSGLALPSETQWEAAARGSDQRRYPWGNDPPTPERANFGDREGRTTPVGAHGQGVGPFGTLDQAGNVWEWCADVWNDEGNRLRGGKLDPLIEEGHAGVRSLRGGSWLSPAEVLQAAFRFGSRAVNRDQSFGFRCVLSSRLEP